MANLKEETIRDLADHGKTLSDIYWIGSYDFRISIKSFLEAADREYDNGYGGQEVAKDLLIVGKDWWMERHEYDGSEWWEYKELPAMPETPLYDGKIELFPGYWRTLFEANNKKESQYGK